MKEQLVISKEQLVASIEQGLNHVAEQPKPVALSSWQHWIQILKFILYFELVLFTGWLFYSAWQTYQVQYGEIKVMDGDLILHRSNLVTDEGTPQHWTSDQKKSNVGDDVPNEHMIASFNTMQPNVRGDSGNKKTNAENEFIQQAFESPGRIDPDIEKLLFSAVIDTDTTLPGNEESTGKSKSIPLTLEDLIFKPRMDRVFSPYNDQSKGEISILDVEDTKVLSSEPKSIWFPKIIRDDTDRKVNPFSDNPILRNMNAQILYLETQGEDEAVLKRLFSGDETFQDMLRNVLTNQDRTSQVNTYDELPQTIFETSDENLQKYFKLANPDAQKYFERKSQGSDFSDNIDQVLDEMEAMIAKRIELLHNKEEVQNHSPDQEIGEELTNSESFLNLSNKNDVGGSESMVPDYRKSGENFEMMLPFGLSWMSSDDSVESKNSSHEKSQGIIESDEISKSEEPTTIKSNQDDLLMNTFWPLFFSASVLGRSSESNSQDTSIPTSNEQTTPKNPSSDSSSFEWLLDFPLTDKSPRKIEIQTEKPSEESSEMVQSKEKVSAEEPLLSLVNPWFPFIFEQSKEESTLPSMEEEVKEELERNLKPEDCQLLNIQGGFKVYDCSQPESTKQIIDEPNPIVWDENYEDYMYTDDYEDPNSSFGGFARVIAPTPEIPLGDDEMIAEDLAAMRKRDSQQQDSASPDELMEEEEEKKEDGKEGEKVLQWKNNKFVLDWPGTSEEEHDETKSDDSHVDETKPSSATGASIRDESSQQADTVMSPKTLENEKSDAPTVIPKPQESNLKSKEGENQSDVSSESKHPRSQPNPYLSPYVVDDGSPNRENIEVDPDLKYEAVMRSLDIVEHLGYTKEKNPEYNQILNKIYSECVEELSADNSWRESSDDQPTENQGKICVRGKSFDEETMRPIWRQKLSFVHDVEDEGAVKNSEESETKKKARSANSLIPDSGTHM